MGDPTESLWEDLLEENHPGLEVVTTVIVTTVPLLRLGVFPEKSTESPQALGIQR